MDWFGGPKKIIFAAERGKFVNCGHCALAKIHKRNFNESLSK